MWRSLEATQTFRRKAFFEEVIILSFSILFNDQTLCTVIRTDVNLTTTRPLGVKNKDEHVRHTTVGHTFILTRHNHAPGQKLVTDFCTGEKRFREGTFNETSFSKEKEMTVVSFNQETRRVVDDLVHHPSITKLVTVSLSSAAWFHGTRDIRIPHNSPDVSLGKLVQQFVSSVVQFCQGISDV